MCCSTWATARSQQLLFMVLAASLWCFTAGCHVKSPLLAWPNTLSNRSVLHDGRKQDRRRRLFTTQRPPRISTSYKFAAPRYRLPCQARTQGGGGGGGSPLPMNPLDVSSFVSKPTACAPTACESTFSRSIMAVFHRMRMRRSFNFPEDLIVAERARPCYHGYAARGGELATDCAVWAQSGRIISVQNGEHSFCSKRRHDEEKSFNGHSFLPAKRGASSAEPQFSARLAYGEGINERNPLPRLINIVVVRRQEDVGLLRTDRPPLTLSWSSGLRIIS